jgi:transcription factor IIIB subunit 2
MLVYTILFQVLEENAIVSEITFGENSSGAAVMQGQFVSADRSK